MLLVMGLLLVLELDQTLSGASTARSIITKRQEHKQTKFLYRNARSLDSKSKAVLTSALILKLCHLDYASAIWYSGLTQTFKSKLQIVQNKIISFILDLQARSHFGNQGRSQDLGGGGKNFFFQIWKWKTSYN